MSKHREKPQGMPIINDRAAGIDIGSRFHVVAVPPDLSDEPVRTFQAFTGDLECLADWLVSIGIKTVAMESPSSPPGSMPSSSRSRLRAFAIARSASA